jgi:transposase
MELVHRRCAGLDVHKDTVVACLRLVEGETVRREVRTFGTTTGALYELADWLSAAGVTHLVMEATGGYWKPVWHVLEESFELLLANAQHVKNVPGRKTDVNDATWLAELLAHALVRGSFVPKRPVQQLRDLTRARKQLVRERVQHVQRLQKVLEDANLKLASVISNIVGRSGRALLDAIVAGETDPTVLAQLAHARLEATPEAAIRVKRSYERALFYRLKARRGPGRAIIAVAASMLGAIYHMLRHGVPYRDLGADHFEKRDRQQITRSLVRRLQHLGYQVDLREAA